MRRSKRAGIKRNAWLFGLAVPSVALFVVFSLMPYGSMVERWPLHIGQEEVMNYQRFFDRRPGQHSDAQAPVYALEAMNGLCEADAMFFSAEGFRDSTVVKSDPLREGAIAIRFPQGRMFQGQQAIDLVPASLHSLKQKYIQAFADSLGLACPEIRLVRVTRCGKDLGLFLVQESTSPERIRKYAPYGTQWLGEALADDGTKAAIDLLRASPAAFDTSATAAVCLLGYAEGRKDIGTRSDLLFDPVIGRITPLYHVGGANDRADSTSGPGFGAAIASAANHQRVMHLASVLRSDSSSWSARLLAIDSLWVPVLAGDRNIGLVQAEVDRTRNGTMQRAFHPDPEGFFGTATSGSTTTAEAKLDPWLEQYRSGRDTLRFVRGKYVIDHSVVIPQGMALVLEKGTRWNIAPGVHVVVQGELHIRGTDLNPVFLRPQEPAAPYGTLAVQGNGRTRCRIKGLQMSGGSEAWVEGVHHAGMLSLHNVDAVFSNCRIGEAFGPNAINVQRGTVTLSDCNFSDAHRGMVGLDEVKGSVERCSFTGAVAGDTLTVKGGSGLSLNAAEVLVRACTFSSLTEGSSASSGSIILVTGSTYSSDRIALSLSDGATAHVDGSTFTGNALVWDLRTDHPIMGEPKVLLYANTLTDNANDGTSKGSGTVTSNSAHDAAIWRKFGLHP